MDKVTCSFCGKNQDDVEYVLVGPMPEMTGPEVFICNRCVIICTEIIKEKETENAT